MNDADVVVAGAVRTPIGSLMGAFADVSAVELGAAVIIEALQRSGLTAETAAAHVDEVILGNVLQAGLGQNPARQALLKAGLPIATPGVTINKVCGSGLKAVMMAAQSIQAGDAELLVAGGMENMSQAPHLLPRSRAGFKAGDVTLLDSMMRDGLMCAIGDESMGITAERIAASYGITREEQDAFALGSQVKAEQAAAEGRFAAELTPIVYTDRKGKEVRIERDEHPRSGQTQDMLARLRPAFRKDGTVTAGNASGINDGAAALVVCSLRKARELGLTPLARIRSYASAGVDPAMMGLGPVPATLIALRKAGMSIRDIELVEANEAFAVQSLAVMRELELDPEIVNVNGGAIALGHPIGASGARVLVTLLHEMKRRSAATGLAALCVGGGHGVSMIVEQWGGA